MSDIYVRTKYIVVPEKITYLRIHSGDQYWHETFGSCVVSTAVALMQHYKELRKQLKTGEIHDQDMVTDTTIFKYGDALVKRVQQVYNQVEDYKCIAKSN